ncbi:LAMI_0F00452g1_1 [Lachancea mirantina]|uniref:LAMI_0F00452g1_1 n=1 Tax=Lachancea mirantina TaxID=1230905 RepID=A0A1G4JVS1_9SACH|nr:LAMI_0F00452g1_1 [Lachancea mirantina]
MELSGKRTHSSLGDTPANNGFSKRRMMGFMESTAGSPILRRLSVPRSSFLLTKKCQDNGSDDDNTSSDKSTPVAVNQSCKKPAVHFKMSPAVDAKLLKAVSPYSDSDDVSTLPPSSLADHSYALEKRVSPSRHSSFSSTSRKAFVPRSDTLAQERCFDYLLQSIDEVWARYCNTTSTAEAQVHDNLCDISKSVNAYSNSVENEKFYSSSVLKGICSRRLPALASDDKFSEDDSDDASGYKSEATNLTEYETDCDLRKVSTLPDSMKLQCLKDRLNKAKNDLEEVYGSTDIDDCARFWRRWDMIKYSAVETMEEDDDDEIIENVIEELERGRQFTN